MLENIPKATKNLIIINVIVFVATLINQDFMVSRFALFFPASQYFRPWQIITHMFMHGGVWHIVFNMYALFMFGSVIERTIGEKKFLILYFVCGLGAVALHLGVQYIQAQTFMNGIAEGSVTAMANYNSLKLTPTLGASGAIYGLLIAYAMLFPDARLSIIFLPFTSMSSKTWIIIFAILEFVTGITGTIDGIAHFAHLGGMLFGWLLIRYWRKKGTLFNDYTGYGY